MFLCVYDNFKFYKKVLWLALLVQPHVQRSDRFGYYCGSCWRLMGCFELIIARNYRWKKNATPYISVKTFWVRYTSFSSSYQRQEDMDSFFSIQMAKTVSLALLQLHTWRWYLLSLHLIPLQSYQGNWTPGVLVTVLYQKSYTKALGKDGILNCHEESVMHKYAT